MQLKDFYWILSIFLIITLSIGSIVAVDPNSLTNLTNVNNSNINDTVNYNQDNSSYLENENVVNNSNGNILKYDNLNTISAENGGIRNISFTNGYNGYCINMTLHNAESGQTFTVTNTSNIINHLDGSSVGEYIKILFYNYWDTVNSNKTATSDAIWRFTDGVYIPYTSSDYDGPVVSSLVKNVINDYNMGLRVPDYGAIKKINNTNELVFDFISLDSGSDAIQNYFGFKVLSREIVPNSTVNNTTIVNNTTNSTNVTNVTNSTGNNTNNNINNNNTDGNNRSSAINNVVNNISRLSNGENQRNVNGTGLYNTGNPLYLLFAALIIITSIPFYRKR